jgi:hypothetical protein
MADTAAFCVDYLFPRVPTQQYVLLLPNALRFKMAYSPDATSVVLGAFISAINSDLRRSASGGQSRSAEKGPRRNSDRYLDRHREWTQGRE